MIRTHTLECWADHLFYGECFHNGGIGERIDRAALGEEEYPRMNQLFRVEQSAKTSDDYLTPRWVFDALGLEFDLDVAAPPWDTYVPAQRKFTKADDGLIQPWEGRVWMNPPYSKPKAWAERFVDHKHGVALLPFSQSQWTIDIWNTDAALMLPPKWFDFEGTRPGFSSTAASRQKWSMWCPVFFAAFGDECVAALHNLGVVRTQVAPLLLEIE